MKFCVVIPTYNNARTLAAVVEGSRRCCESVFVVDDGSTDDTRNLLGTMQGIEILQHDRNLGKGKALRYGLAVAHERGFTHAVALDSDGQHHPTDIAKLMAASNDEPHAIILGGRDLKGAGAGPGSRIGCTNSNFWVWVQTGKWLPDTQTGFRVYPLEPIGKLALFTTGFEFEIEVLVRASWTGVHLRSHPVSVTYFQGADRVSHFRPWRDFFRIALLNCRLIVQRAFIPPPALHVFSLRTFRELPTGARWREAIRQLFVIDPGSSGRIAASVGLGCFMGLTPFWGFQLVLALFTAHLLGLSKPIAALASNISIPVLIPFIVYASLVIGRVTLGRATEDIVMTSGGDAPPDFAAWILGSFILATAVGLVAMAVTWLALQATRASVPRKERG